jgi:hypothetical protein
MKVTMDSKSKTLTIVIDCDPKAERSSASGKSRIIASTNGNLASELQVNGKPVIVGLNCYVKA